MKKNIYNESSVVSDITVSTRKNLRWKALWYMIKNDKGFKLTRLILHHPIKYTASFIKSIISSKTFLREGSLFIYNMKDSDEFINLLHSKKTLLILGFSYCQKPRGCPVGRFTSCCHRDINNKICEGCFIGDTIALLPIDGIIPIIVTTVHQIGEEILDIVDNNTDRDVIFLITACELSLTMFGDFGNMLKLKGIGVKFDEGCCSSIKAFIAAEHGLKPMVTTLSHSSECSILNYIKERLQS